MAPTREERFLMRQRGAGTRQIGDFGFHFSLPAAPGSVRNTPSSARRANPASATRQRSTRKTHTPTPAPAGSSRGAPSDAIITQQDAEGSATKRRRIREVTSTPTAQLVSLEEVSEEEAQDATAYGNALQDVQKSPQTAKRRKKRKSVLLKPKRKSHPSAELATAGTSNLPETEDDEDQLQGGLPDQGEDQQEDEVESGEDQLRDAAKPTVNTSTATRKAMSKKKKRKSIVLGRRKRRSSEGTTVPGGQTKSNRAIQEQAASGEETDHEASTSADAPSTQIKRDRPKLQNIFRSKRPLAVSKGNATVRPTGVSATSSRNNLKERLKKMSGKKLRGSPQEEREDDENAEGGSEEGQAQTGATKGKRRRERDVEESEQDGEATSARKRQKLKSKSSKAQSSSAKSSRDRRTKEAGDDKIHVTVQRISHVHRLNFNPDSDDDLAGPGAFPKKKSPNAIDVLAQICREMIGKTITTVKGGFKDETNVARKNELKRKRELFERYGDELDGRLFQMTTALDHNHALGVKLKHAAKKKASLRDELLEMRRQRQELELQMDEMRAGNEEAAKAANEEHELNNLLHDIELAVERGKAAQEQDGDDDGDAEEGNGEPTLAMRLRQVADNVSSADGRIGMLERIKDFNKLLEEAIDKL